MLKSTLIIFWVAVISFGALSACAAPAVCESPCSSDDR
jgi:hypothetical protein